MKPERRPLDEDGKPQLRAMEQALADQCLKLEKERDEVLRTLADLVARIDLNGGLGEYIGGAPFALRKAHALLDKYPEPPK